MILNSDADAVISVFPFSPNINGVALLIVSVPAVAESSLVDMKFSAVFIVPSAANNVSACETGTLNLTPLNVLALNPTYTIPVY